MLHKIIVESCLRSTKLTIYILSIDKSKRFKLATEIEVLKTNKKFIFAFAVVFDFSDECSAYERSRLTGQGGADFFTIESFVKAVKVDHFSDSRYSD